MRFSHVCIYFSFNARSFFTDFTPGTNQAVQDALALVMRSGTSPVSETTPALVCTALAAFFRCESFALCCQSSLSS